MSTAEAADALGVSDETVRQWLDRGILPEVLRGASRRRLVPRHAVEQVVSASMEGWDPAEAQRRLVGGRLRAVS
jgi:excisionase family DNA binding protein